MNRLLALSLFAVLLNGCFLWKKGKKDPEDLYVRTPQGYWVTFTDYGTVSTGRATLDQIYAWHAMAVERGCRVLSGKYGWPIEALRGMARDHGYILVDHYKTRSSASPSGFITGQWIPRPDDSTLPQVITCLYPHLDGYTVPVEAPPWTVTPWPDGSGKYRYAVMPGSGGHFPSLDHELGHAYTKDPRFEH